MSQNGEIPHAAELTNPKPPCEPVPSLSAPMLSVSTSTASRSLLHAGKKDAPPRYLRRAERERAHPITVSVPSPPLPLQEFLEPQTSATEGVASSLFVSATTNAGGAGDACGKPEAPVTLADLVAHITALEEEKQSLLADVVVLDGPLQSEFMALEEEREELSQAQAHLGEAIRAAVVVREGLQTRVNELKQTHSKRENDVRKAILRSSQLRKQLQRLDRDREEAKKRRLAATQGYRDSTREQQRLGAVVSALESERESLLAAADHGETVLSKLEAQLELVRKEIASLRVRRGRVVEMDDDEMLAICQNELGGSRSDLCADTNPVTSSAAAAAAAAASIATDTDEGVQLNPDVLAQQDQLATLKALYERVQEALTRQRERKAQTNITFSPALEQVSVKLRTGRGVCQRAHALIEALEAIVPNEELRYTKLK